MSLIFKQLLQTLTNANIATIEHSHLEKLTNSTFYDQVNALSRSTIFFYATFAIATLYIFSRITINTNLILATFIVAGTIYYWINNDNNTIRNEAVDYNEKLKYLETFLFTGDVFNKRKNPYNNILNILPNNMPPETKSYLHMSKPVVEFYFSIRELSQYNPANFSASLNSMNNVLKLNIIMEAGAQYPKYTLDNAKIQADSCLNTLQGCIYSLPSNSIYNKFFNDALKNLQELVSLYINAMTKIAQNKFETEKRTGTLNIDSQQVLTDVPNPNDTKAVNFNPHFNFF
jgi:hypothetical protein